MSEPYETYRGFNIKIKQDECPADPRDNDNLGIMVCFHKRYVLGDTGGNPKWRKRTTMYHAGKKEDIPQFRTPDDFLEYMNDSVKDKTIPLILPLMLYDHSGIWMSTETEKHWWHAGWDSSQVGFIYVTMAAMLHEYHNPGPCDMETLEGAEDALNRAERVLKSEVEEYSQYISGDVWYYVVEDLGGTWMDSCGGYYGSDFETNGLLSAARGHIDWHITKAYKDRAEQVKTWIRQRVPHIYRTPMQLGVSP